MVVKSTALPPLFGNGMPLLEGLYLRSYGPVDHNLDVCLTSQRFPRLQTLELVNTLAPHDLSLYAQLHTLELNHCYHILPFEGFLNALAASVQLEELIIFILPDISSGSERTRNLGPFLYGAPTVLLPRLRTFTVTGNSIAGMSRFLAHLYLQPSAVLDIHVDARGLHVPADDSDTPNTTLSYSAMLPPDPSATLPSLAMATAVCTRIQESSGDCQLRYEYPSPVDSEVLPDSDPQVTTATLSLQLHHSQGNAFMRTALNDLVRCFRLSPLTSLEVKGNHAYGTVAAWESVFRAFPLLEELVIDSWFGDPLSDVTVVFRGLHAASTSPVDVRSGSGSPSGDPPALEVACANLQCVYVRGMGLVEAYEALRECFRWRGERGVVVKVLDLTNLRDQDAAAADVRSALVEDLQGAVETLRVYSSPKRRGGG
ncbi:hypothetical protein GSI_03442 [Ganoderma sinense ZZ0214-1]|uniref:F-box domain-containing protein n=1 Tax=Ganoderma sinense ZZ0214-1 TaxID=1077348 RepID=A0A2G8SLN2_9APHY|nr:hypothetical protein GSI_03442 [Ganoderma sinense ZZ0214-1]